MSFKIRSVRARAALRVTPAAALVACAGVMALPTSVLAQCPAPGWAETPKRPVGRGSFGGAYDHVRGKYVLFGGVDGTLGRMYGDTWEFDSTRWTQVALTGPSPSHRDDMCLSFDSDRRMMVMFGGYDGTVFGDTWEFDGTNWAQRTPATSPSPRRLYGLAYDPVRRQTILFGGRDATGAYLNETWAWDGTTWTLLTPANAPSARRNPAMTFDARSNTIVLFGGSDGSTVTNDTWTWNGTNWTQVSAGGGPNDPPARFVHGMTYDRIANTVYMSGGFDFTTFFDDTWEWTGTQWVQLTAPGLVGRGFHNMSYDLVRGVSLVFGGVTIDGSGVQFFSDLRWFDGNEWSLRNDRSTPSARIYPVMAHDSTRGNTVLFGGKNGSGLLGDTWVFNGETWTSLSPATSPAARERSAAAFHRGSGKVVLFGGQNGAFFSGETWLFDGSNWSMMGGPGPSPRRAHVMAYDSARDVVVLFGGDEGAGGVGFVQDTWEWNGTAWTLKATTGPTPRVHAAMTYDAVRGNVVLFGGSDNVVGLTSDTWVWNGTVWTQLSVSGPSARDEAAMSFDAARGKVVMTGGFTLAGRSSETWEFDGANWLQLNATPNLGARQGHGQVFEETRGVTFAFGGLDPTRYITDGRWLETGAPSFQTQPVGRSTGAGQSVTFSAFCAGVTPIAYQWQKDGVNISDGGPYSGVLTNTLTVSNITAAEAGMYRCVATNSCGSSPSTAAQLVIGCVADYDDGTGTGTPDGGVTIDDLLYYIQLWRAGNAGADIDDGSSTGVPDGGVTIDDLLYYLVRYDAGC